MVSGLFGYAVLNFAIFFFQAPQGGPRRKSSGSGGVARLLLPLDVLLLGCAGYPIRGYRWLRGPILSHCPCPAALSVGLGLRTGLGEGSRLWSAEHSSGNAPHGRGQ
jgi:hypothetical protein